MTNFSLEVSGRIGAVDFGHNIENIDPIIESVSRNDELNSYLPSTYTITGTFNFFETKTKTLK